MSESPKRLAKHRGRVTAKHRSGKCVCLSKSEYGEAVENTIRYKTTMSPEDLAELEAFESVRSLGAEAYRTFAESRGITRP